MVTEGSHVTEIELLSREIKVISEKNIRRQKRLFTFKMVATCFSRLPALKVLTICSGRLCTCIYICFMSFLLSFLTVEFRIPLEVKELGENIIILKVLLHMYTKCIHGREENTSCEISTVHVDRVCY